MIASYHGCVLPNLSLSPYPLLLPLSPVSSPMDEVLASLKRGTFHLRKVDQRPLPPTRDDDDESSNILAQIRQGVKLRRVPCKERKDQGDLPASTDPLTRSIHEALRRIKEASPESDSDDEGLTCPDWES